MSKVSAGIAVMLFVHLWWRSWGSGGSYAGPTFVDLADGPATLWDVSLLAFFSLAHSGFATLWFRRVVGLERSAMRRCYVHLTLVATLVVWALWAPLSRPVLWNLSGIWNPLFAGVRVVSAAGLVWTLRGFGVLGFLGDARANPQDGSDISVDGAFALCRHPLYFFLILFIGATTFMPLGRALLAGAVVAYFALGSKLEERKMQRELGSSYSNYRAATPWLVPTPASLVRAFTRPSLRRS